MKYMYAHSYMYTLLCTCTCTLYTVHYYIYIVLCKATYHTHGSHLHVYVDIIMYMYMYYNYTVCYYIMHVFKWEMRRKKERSKQGQTNKQTNKAKQHSTPKAVTFPRKNELPQVGLEPTTLYTLDRALYQLSWLGPNLTSHSTPDECTCSYIHVYSW